MDVDVIAEHVEHQQLADERELWDAFRLLVARLIECELRDWPTLRMSEVLEQHPTSYDVRLRQALRELAAVAHHANTQRRLRFTAPGQFDVSKAEPVAQQRRHEALLAFLPVLQDELADWPSPRLLQIVGDLDDDRHALLRQTLRDFILAAQP